MAGSTHKVPDSTPLTFKFSAHILEDLGVNLYTSVNKALVEFVANAYDAESATFDIRFDPAEVKREAEVCRKQYELELAKAKSAGQTDTVRPLEKRTIGDNVQIILEDKGHGMTKEELEDKFLVVGRRRRDDESSSKTKTGKRLVMGRKGLGKLAGFGIAQRVEIMSRSVGSSYTTVIALDYDRLVAQSGGKESNAEVPTEVMTEGGLKSNGTRITLSRLVFQTVHSVDEPEILSSLGRHFGMLKSSEFKIRVNRAVVTPPERKYAYAWPEDARRKHDQLVSETLDDKETGKKFTFQYRLRFAEQKKYLMAAERGVRVYAHNRLASLPSLLDVNTNAHGFRYSDYLDGIVVADFIDELPTDYIATDRSDLRWETPPLAQLREFLSGEIQSALGKFADKRMAENEQKVNRDAYTVSIIKKADLPEHRKKTALKFATALATSEAKGVDSDYYRTTIKEVISSLGHGDIITSINKLAEAPNPDLSKLVSEITRSTKREFDEFLKFAQVRLKGISGLEKIVRAQDFRNGKCDEKQLHRLFSKNPWLIDPMLSQFLTSDERETVLSGQLSKHLAIGKFAPSFNPRNTDERDPLKTNKRPDLVFLLTDEASDHATGRVIVIELKAPNTPLHSEHLDQLCDYIRRIEKWRDSGQRKKQFEVHGQLIGSFGGDEYRNNNKVERLHDRMNKERNACWKVRDIADVLTETKNVHKDLVKTFESAQSGS